MKWLIISKAPESSEKVNQYLLSKGAQVFVFDSDSEHEKIVSGIEEADNFIVLDGDELYENQKFLFLYGLIAEKGRTVLVQEKNSVFLNELSSGFEKCVFFSSRVELLKFLRKNFKDYYESDKRKNALDELLSLGFPFNADSMVHFIEKEKIEMVQLVHDAGLDLDSWTESGVPVLCAATRCDKIEFVKWLLKHGADVNIISRDRGYSPVMDAVWKKNLDMVKIFIKAGADLSVMSSDGQPILVLAVGNGDAKIVEALLKAGADPDVMDGMGMSARSYASLFKNEVLMKLMKKFPKKDGVN